MKLERTQNKPVYLDCNATTPIEPDVFEGMSNWFQHNTGNAGSRTHIFGLHAKHAVQRARTQVASVVNASTNEVIFTSGATEANNLAILGIAEHGVESKRQHIVATAIEHKAVLEPIEALEKRGFSVSLVYPDSSGAITIDAVQSAIRPDTLLVSVMHVNNETGVCQPINEIAEILDGHDAYFHVDAAQGFGKDLPSLRSERIDFISVSSHKIYGPLGIGALIVRRRNYQRPPLVPLTFGGGQEYELRPGTLPVPLIVGFGIASELSCTFAEARTIRCAEIRKQALSAFAELNIRIHGDPHRTLPHVLNFSIPGIDSEAIMLAIKDRAAVSNGSACTSQSYAPSHVLSAMGLPSDAIAGAIRMSWCHNTQDVDWADIVARILTLA